MTTTRIEPGEVHVRLTIGSDLATDGAVRTVLSEYLGLSADRIPLGRRPNGQLVVGGDSGLRLSVSHTPGLLLLAVSVGGRVGVDVELVRDGRWRLLPQHALTAREHAALERMPERERSRAFLRYWTRKEALLKAAGVGLAVEPRLVEVTAPEEPPRVLALPPQLGRPTDWSLIDLPLAGFIGAIAVEGAQPRLFVSSRATTPRQAEGEHPRAPGSRCRTPEIMASIINSELVREESEVR